MKAFLTLMFTKTWTAGTVIRNYAFVHTQVPEVMTPCAPQTKKQYVRDMFGIGVPALQLKQGADETLSTPVNIPVLKQTSRNDCKG
jgi:hypothetical protein